MYNSIKPKTRNNNKRVERGGREKKAYKKTGGGRGWGEEVVMIETQNLIPTTHTALTAECDSIDWFNCEHDRVGEGAPP